MMEDDWFLPDVGGQPLQKFSNVTWRKQKDAPSNLQTDHKKTNTTRQIFQKNCKELFTVVSAMVKRHAG